MLRSLYATIIVGASLFAPILLAQTDATVSGTVLDPSGASVIGATVTAVNVDTGVTTPTTSNTALPPNARVFARKLQTWIWPSAPKSPST